MGLDLMTVIVVDNYCVLWEPFSAAITGNFVMTAAAKYFKNKSLFLGLVHVPPFCLFRVHNKSLHRTEDAAAILV